MIIVNADDFGRLRSETDAAIACYRKGRITSVTAMMFMTDSERAAELANESGMEVGLHLNLSQAFAAAPSGGTLVENHDRVVRFIASSRYSMFLYNPALRQQFLYVFQAQMEEFLRLYGRPPSHIDGHQHRHLCANILLDRIIPEGERVRRNFSFWPGEKSLVNLGYRRLVDSALARRHTLTDYFFSLEQCLQGDRMERVFKVSRAATVELMTHPLKKVEFDYLMSDGYLSGMDGLTKGTYSCL